jgi:hypothetical protein
MITIAGWQSKIISLFRLLSFFASHAMMDNTPNLLMSEFGDDAAIQFVSQPV